MQLCQYGLAHGRSKFRFKVMRTKVLDFRYDDYPVEGCDINVNCHGGPGLADAKSMITTLSRLLAISTHEE